MKFLILTITLLGLAGATAWADDSFQEGAQAAEAMTANEMDAHANSMQEMEPEPPPPEIMDHETGGSADDGMIPTKLPPKRSARASRHHSHHHHHQIKKQARARRHARREVASVANHHKHKKHSSKAACRVRHGKKFCRAKHKNHHHFVS